MGQNDPCGLLWAQFLPSPFFSGVKSARMFKGISMLLQTNSTLFKHFVLVKVRHLKRTSVEGVKNRFD